MGRRNRKFVGTKSTSGSAKAKHDHVVSAWEAAKHGGNVMYTQSQYDKAIEHYTLAIGLLETDTTDKGLL